ncbi:hypothetical protein C7T35_14930 [Variovorax sp. WS11]|uniref:hypothetical protein n=1 Tax=Variovorax sp. WS11 TaxID=1105204 RepID=UPI000D0CE076|nr:hypothetical protein [Variovorax sp. WS11]NDZ12143.1 hypothetical protein [Variovorax sp. WS11]PSL83678.1 hypothetical protein C7T35_14930 [Variovorax sp. WS11]
MILVKTEAGQQVFKDRSVRLTPRQRSAFILFDGKRSVSEVLEAGMGIGREDIDQMVEQGLLGQVGGMAEAANAGTVAMPAGPTPSPARQPERPVAATLHVEASATHAMGLPSAQQRYKDAYPIATQLTGSLGLRGFRLNLSVEGTSTYEELLALAPKIRAAVGDDKAVALDRALGI